MALTLNTKTYSFSGIANAITTYLERSGGIAAAFSAVTASLRMDSGSSREAKSRIQWKLQFPVVADEASACACPGDVVIEADASIAIRLSKNMALAERTDFALRLKDLVASTEFQSSIINLQQPTA